ncbi:MAG: histidine kinase dimerization/phosphoacceptor domain -containing protein [Saprospiraceae bacterium]|nr:histidine kinase dimerization/phosphoacceptor domain -containing protein [Saprospiraceae bacterium]
MFKLRIIYLYVVLLLPFIIKAQTENSPEKLRILLSESKPGKQRVDLLLELGQYYLYKPGEEQSDLDSAMLFAKQAQTLSQSLLQYKIGIYEGAFLIGNIFLERQNVGAAIAMIPKTQDTSRVKLLNIIGAHYVFKPEEVVADLDSAALFLLQGKNLINSLNNKNLQIENLRLLAFCYLEKKEVNQLKKCLMEISQVNKNVGNREYEAQIWQEFGTYLRFRGGYEDGIIFLQKAYEIYQQLGKKEKSIETLKEIADTHLNQGKLDQSEQELLEVIERYKAIGFKNLHYTYDLLAAVSTLKGNLDKALLYAHEMIKSMEVTGDSTFACTFYTRTGRIYWQLGQIEKSIEWYKKAFGKSDSYNYSLYSQIVEGYLKLGKPQAAFSFLQDVAKKFPPDSYYEKSCFALSIGLCYNAFGQYNLAEKHYKEMLHYESLLDGQDHYTSTVNFTIGEFYTNIHKHAAAAPYLRKVLALPEGIVTTQRLKDTYFLLFKVDSAAGNYLSAIQHFQMHKTLNDSLFNETKSQQIEELQIQYETEQKEKNIQLLQNESQLQESRLVQANLAKNITFGGITLLLIIVSLLYNRYRLKQRSNRQLEIQQIEINQTNRSLQKLLEEKEWLLREIHHRVKNNLQIVMSLLNTQSFYLVNDAALSAIRDSQHRIRSISLIHQKLYQSQNIASINMPTYIQELVEYLQDSFDTNYNIHFDLNIEPIELDVTQAVPLGLILNEAISNAIKYAFPNRKGIINITMQQVDEENYSLIIADNGIGLPIDFDMNKHNSLGMSLMKGLSKQLNGSFEMKSKNGLTISILFIKEEVIKSDIKLQEETMAA